MDTPANLAARHRPRRFADLTGQRHVAAILRAAIVAGRLPQQLLFTGGSGLGKTTVARIAAAAQLCQTPLEARDEGDSCGQCESCDLIGRVVSAHPDVIELDAASHGGKDEIVELVARAQTLPLQARYKVYIIDEVHALTGAGVQAFLKLLEEPPAHVLFMLATTNPEKLSSRAGGTGTIRGRCVELELLVPGRDELVDNLLRIAQRERWPLSPEVAGRVVDATDPRLGVRGTVNMLSRITGALSPDTDPDPAQLDALLGTLSVAGVEQLTRAIRHGDLAAALTATTELRRRAPDTAVRNALAQWARRELTEALDRTRALAPQVPLRRLERILGAADGPLHTDLLVARLTHPAVDPDPDTLAAQLHEAHRVITHLERLLSPDGRTLPIPTPSDETAPADTPDPPPAPPPGP